MTCLFSHTRISFLTNQLAYRRHMLQVSCAHWQVLCHRHTHIGCLQLRPDKDWSLMSKARFLVDRLHYSATPWLTASACTRFLSRYLHKISCTPMYAPAGVEPGHARYPRRDRNSSHGDLGPGLQSWHRHRTPTFCTSRWHSRGCGDLGDERTRRNKDDCGDEVTSGG